MHRNLRRLWNCVLFALPGGLKPALWLIKLTVPVSLAVFLLDYLGWLFVISSAIEPVFRFMGLPGESAFVLITSIFTNVYSAIGVITTLHIPYREATILGVMCLISHNFLIETLVMKKTGSNPWRMVILRLVMSFVAGLVLNLVLPGKNSVVESAGISEHVPFFEAFLAWGSNMFWMCVKIIILVSMLMILQKALEEFGIIKKLAPVLRSAMKAMGLAEAVSFSWVVGNAIGLAYGSAIMMEQVQQRKMSLEEADLMNHHLAVSHSQLEDPLLFVAIGLSAGWMIWPRFILAVGVVWARRLELKIRGKYKTNPRI